MGFVIFGTKNLHYYEAAQNKENALSSKDLSILTTIQSYILLYWI